MVEFDEISDSARIAFEQLGSFIASSPYHDLDAVLIDRLLESKSELGVNLRKQKETLESFGARVEVRLMVAHVARSGISIA